MKTAIHTPTGKRCVVMLDNGMRCFCNFGANANSPFCWVQRGELQFL